MWSKTLFLLFFLTCTRSGFSQCSTPIGNESTRCGEGSVVLTATGGTKALYNWYDALVDGNFLGSGASFSTPSIATQDTFYVAQYDTGSTTDAIAFDGTNDYIAIENFNYTSGGNKALTVECWIKTSNGADHIISSFDRNRYWRLEINGSGGGTGQIGFDLMTDGGQLDFGSSSTVNSNTWRHVAAVFDNGTINLYIDGVLDATTTMGTTFGDGSTSYGFVGVGSEATAYNGAQGPTTYFDGDMDEFRIWSVARTATEIQNYKDKCLTGSELGLEVYYRMDGSAAADSIVDQSVGTNDGTLFNFTLPGAWLSTGTPLNECPNCESTRDTSIARIDISPTPLIGNDTCATATVTLDAGPGFSSYLWSTGETSQTIVADTTRFYSVTVDSTGTPCTTTDGISVSLLTQPLGTDTSRCGPGTVTLTASGGTGKYNWFDAAVGGNILGEGTPWTSPTITNTDTIYLASIENDTTDQALTFDGVDDYVSLNMAFNAAGALPTVTIEAWVKTTETGGAYTDNWAILDFDRSDYFSFFVHGGDGSVGFSTTDNSGTIDDFYGPVANRVNDGTWHHVVGVYDGTDKKIYVDGTLVATKTNPHGGKPLGTGTTRYGFIGDGSEAGSENGPRNNLYFKGEVDEIRLWSDVRNLLEIQENKDKCILGVESNLLAYYKMENGAGSAVLTDHSNSGNDGTLRNMNLTGAWINTGPVVTCSCGDSPRDTVFVEIKVVPTVELGNDTCTLVAYSLDAGAGMSSYLWQDGSTTQTLSASSSKAYWVQVDSTGTTCKGRDTIVVNVGKAADPIATDSSRCGTGNVVLKGTGQGNLKWYDSASGGSLLGEGDSLIVGPLSSDSTFYFTSTVENTNNLEFDGSNDYVTIKNYNYSSGGLSAVTVEAWVKTTSAGDNIVASFDRSDYWRLEINGDAAGPGQVGFGIYTDGGIIDLGSTGTVNDGAWHHIAAVYNSGTATIYIDGVADGTASLGSTFGSGSTRYGFLGIGSEANTEGGTTGPAYYFDGEMDEVRVWSTARSPANLALYKDSCLIGNEANLEIYYRMAEGSGTALNDIVGSSHGAVVGPVWKSTGNPYSCSPCSESDRVPITATIYDAIDSVKTKLSCPGLSGSTIVVNAYGGTGNFDYAEKSGVLSFSGSYGAGEVLKTLPNGGNFDLIVKDQNNCRDTITAIATEPNPSPSTVADASSSNNCLIPGENGWFYLVNSSNKAILAINPNGDNLGDVSASVYVRSTAGVSDSNAYMRRSFVITPEFQPTGSATVRLYFSDADYSNLVDSANATVTTDDDISSIASLGVTKYQGPNEDGIIAFDDATSLLYLSQTGNGTQFGQKYIEFSTPSFSEMWVHGSGGGDPLPVELLEFSGELKEGKIHVRWKTGSELNSDYFVLERSEDGVSFNPIGYLTAAGNSSTLLSYSYADIAPLAGDNYYRLTQVDIDGSSTNSSIIIVNNPINESTSPRILVIPNPTTGAFQLKILEANFSTLGINFEIYNPTGKLVYTSKWPGAYDPSFVYHFNLQNQLEYGMYHLKVFNDQEVLTTTFVLQK